MTEMTEKDQWREAVEKANLIRSMINHTGWKDILEPLLKNKQQSLIQSFLTTKFTSMTEVVYIQQTINAIDEIFKTIEFLTAQGAVALEQLKQHPS